MPADVLEYLMEKGVDPDIHNADGQPSVGMWGAWGADKGKRDSIIYIVSVKEKVYSRYGCLKITKKCSILPGFCKTCAKQQGIWDEKQKACF